MGSKQPVPPPMDFGGQCSHCKGEKFLRGIWGYAVCPWCYGTGKMPSTGPISPPPPPKKLCPHCGKEI